MARRFKKLLKRARDLKKLGAHKRHRVRIAAKKLRYMGEFFATLLADEQAKESYEKVIGQLEKIQKGLGRLQDEVASRALLAEILGEAKAEQLAAKSPVDRKAELRKATKAVTKLVKATPFWLKWQKDQKHNQE